MEVHEKLLGFNLKLILEVTFIFLQLFYRCDCNHISDTSSFVQSSYSEICTPTLSEWVSVDAFESERYNFIGYEKKFHSYCKNITPYLIEGNFFMPNSCNSLTICNSTYCHTYQREAMKFLYALPLQCATNLGDGANIQYIMPRLQSNQTTFQPQSRYQIFDLRQRYSTSHKEYQLSFLRNSINFPALYGNNFMEYLKKECQSHQVSDLLYEGQGELPAECDQLYFCSLFTCYKFTLTANAFSYLFKRRTEPSIENLELPGNCKVLKLLTRLGRGVWRYQDPDEMKILEKTNFNLETRSQGLLRFNLPGYRYCGPGTNIEEMDQKGGPINDLDALCRQHDVDYMLGIPAEEADDKLLKGLWDIQSPLLPLFENIFLAKTFFEAEFGSRYTSSLYYFPEKQQSLVFYLSKKSVYDEVEFSPAYTKGKLLEEKWKKILYTVWEGFCYAQQIPEVTQMVRQKQDFRPKPGESKALAPAEAGPSSSDTAQEDPNKKDESTGDDGDANDDDDEAQKYPKIPVQYGKCRLIISEICHINENKDNFIELQRKCPPRMKNIGPVQLKGYHILLIKVGDPSVILMSLVLDGKQLRIVQEYNPESRRPKNNMYFVIGTQATKPDILLENVREFASDPNEPKSIPAEITSTYAVVILHYSSSFEERQALNELALTKHTLGGMNLYRPKPIADTQHFYIKKYLQDVSLYGAPCELLICDEFLKLMPNPTVIEPVYGQFIPIPFVTGTLTPRVLSLNRCVTNAYPMQLDSFTEGVASPGSQNNCPIILKGIFNMRGVLLRKSAQKIILNVHDYFENVYAKRIEVQGTPLQMTSQACSLGTNSVGKVLANYRTGTIETPGNPRNRKIRPHKQCKVDTIYAEFIRDVILDIYAQQRPPFVDEIFKNFKRKVLDDEDTRRNHGEDIKPFTCHEKTFRKILRRLGYKYGKIETRDVLLMRPQIVLWRGKYLTVLRKNRESPNPKKVIYLDETWIDPHGRTSKAWVPAKCTNYRERAKFSYKRHKVSRGPRIIVVNAGGEDGFVPNVMRVYPVHKKDVTGDYHDNINADVYLQWFKDLLVELRKTGEKYIIVQDNAPYHQSSDVPKVRSTMLQMYDWLADNLPLQDRRALFPIHKYRRHELWSMVKELKSQTNFFIVDKLAADEGHQVLRLPPYNCDLSPIEQVWSDVKYEVKISNIDQNVNNVIERAKQIMENYDVEKWRKHVKHIQKLEERYWESDGFFERFFDKPPAVIVPLDDEDDDEDDEDGDDCVSGPEVIRSVVHDDVAESDFEDELLDV